MVGGNKMDLFEFTEKLMFEDAPKLFYEKLPKAVYEDIPEAFENGLEKLSDFIDNILE